MLALALVTAAHRRTWSHEFIWRQLAVAIFIQRLQGRAGIGNFVGINHAIVIRIQRADDRGRWRALTLAGTVLALTTRRRTVVVGILGIGRERESAKRDHQCCCQFCFHSSILFFVFGCKF